MIALGPDWCFTPVLFVLGGFFSAFFEAIIYEFLDWNSPVWYVAQASIAFHWFILLSGILKNPGIPKQIIKRMLKQRQTGKEEED